MASLRKSKNSNRDFSWDVCVKGKIYLDYGRHEVEIKLPKHKNPKEVYLTYSSYGKNVCMAEKDMVGFSVSRNSFVLYADIKHDWTKIKYLVVCHDRRGWFARMRDSFLNIFDC